MRQLRKGPPPVVLEEKGQEWTAEYEASQAGGVSAPQRWRAKEILSGLREETYDKCAYCEGIIGDVSYPHIEHILPKSKRPDLVLIWENLTLGCPVCNLAKSDYYEPTAPLINPYADEPAEHLDFFGPAVLPKLGSDMGARTVTRLHLSRGSLLIERAHRIEALHQLLDRWFRTEGPDKEALAIALDRELGDDREFVQTLRAYAASLGFPAT